MGPALIPDNNELDPDQAPAELTGNIFPNGGRLFLSAIFLKVSCILSRVLLMVRSPTTTGVNPADATIFATESTASLLLPAMKASTILPSLTVVMKSAANEVLNVFTTLEWGNSFCSSSAALLSSEMPGLFLESSSGFDTLMTILPTATSLILAATFASSA